MGGMRLGAGPGFKRRLVVWERGRTPEQQPDNLGGQNKSKRGTMNNQKGRIGKP